MVKSKGQYVNIELGIGINSKKLKRKTSTSRNRTKRSKNSGSCNLNQVVMDRIAKIESKQLEIEAKHAEILSFQRDLKSQLNDLSGNVQNMIADFLNQMDKKFHSNTEEVVLNQQIVLYSPILETGVQDEDNDGSQLKDFEVENDDIIQIDDITPSASRRRTRKTAAVYRSPYILDFVSSGKSKAVIQEIKSCTSALSDEINVVDVNDIVDFEEWFNMGLCKNNKKKKFNDNNKMISPPFSFGILEVADKKWFYDLRTPEECLTCTYSRVQADEESYNHMMQFKAKIQ
ncbi:Uncharacterized protein Fot_56115 [Forsythia ovata]|uniref:Uncharacterized protein n=1 Tax=Forsythia ovata TaxID=205694 RepID=A0ABD1P366_9LAMI